MAFQHICLYCFNADRVARNCVMISGQYLFFMYRVLNRDDRQSNLGEEALVKDSVWLTHAFLRK